MVINQYYRMTTVFYKYIVRIFSRQKCSSNFSREMGHIQGQAILDRRIWGFWSRGRLFFHKIPDPKVEPLLLEGTTSLGLPELEASVPLLYSRESWRAMEGSPQCRHKDAANSDVNKFLLVRPIQHHTHDNLKKRWFSMLYWWDSHLVSNLLPQF